MNIIKKIVRIILGITTFLIGLSGDLLTDFELKKEDLSKYDNFPNQDVIKKSDETAIVGDFNKNENKTEKAGGAEMGRIVFQSLSSIVSGISTSTSIGVIITLNLENYNRVVALPYENIWGIYVEGSKLDT